MADWQVGDLALCVKLGPWVRRSASGEVSASDGPRPGQILTVTHVGAGVFSAVLQFKEYSHGDSLGFTARRFRKITPSAHIEGIDVERRVPVREDA